MILKRLQLNARYLFKSYLFRSKQMSSTVNFFADSFLDRCSDKRKNLDWINEQMKLNQTNFILFHVDKPLVIIDNANSLFSLYKLNYSQIEFLLNFNSNDKFNNCIVLFLGLEYQRLIDENNNGNAKKTSSPYSSPTIYDKSNYTPWFAIDASRYDEDFTNIEKLFSNGCSFLKGNFIRMLSTQNQQEASIIAQARSVFCWHDRNQYCASCGTKTFTEEAGFKRTCPNKSCKSNDKSMNTYAPSNISYPRVDPVVIMLVVNTKKTHFLLGRKKSFPKNMFSCLAGFVEAGESIEEAVKREVFEECGIYTSDIVFHSSQPWPFPSNIMIGCLAYATSDDIVLDNDEIEEAKWFSLEDIEKIIRNEHPDSIMIPPSRAIANRLINYWFENKSKL